MPDALPRCKAVDNVRDYSKLPNIAWSGRARNLATTASVLRCTDASGCLAALKTAGAPDRKHTRYAFWVQKPAYGGLKPEPLLWLAALRAAACLIRLDSGAGMSGV